MGKHKKIVTVFDHKFEIVVNTDKYGAKSLINYVATLAHQLMAIYTLHAMDAKCDSFAVEINPSLRACFIMCGDLKVFGSRGQERLNIVGADGKLSTYYEDMARVVMINDV